MLVPLNPLSNSLVNFLFPFCLSLFHPLKFDIGFSWLSLSNHLNFNILLVSDVLLLRNNLFVLWVFLAQSFIVLLLLDLWLLNLLLYMEPLIILNLDLLKVLALSIYELVQLLLVYTIKQRFPLLLPLVNLTWYLIFWQYLSLFLFNFKIMMHFRVFTHIFLVLL